MTFKNPYITVLKFFVIKSVTKYLRGIKCEFLIPWSSMILSTQVRFSLYNAVFSLVCILATHFIVTGYFIRLDFLSFRKGHSSPPPTPSPESLMFLEATSHGTEAGLKLRRLSLHLASAMAHSPAPSHHVPYLR